MGPNLSKDLFFCSSPNFGQKMGPNLRQDLFLIYLFVLHLILGAQHRSLYPLEKFLSEALPKIYNACVLIFLLIFDTT